MLLEQKLFEMAWRSDLQMRQKWDPDIQDFKVLENINEDIIVVYRLYRLKQKSPSFADEFLPELQ